MAMMIMFCSFRHNKQVAEPSVFDRFWLANTRFAKAPCTFFWCYLQKVPWSCQCYWDFDLQMCFSPQQGALFADPFPKWHPNPPASRAYLSEHPGARNDGKQSHIFDFLFRLSDWLLQLSISRMFGFQTSFNYPSNTLWWWAAEQFQSSDQPSTILSQPFEDCPNPSFLFGQLLFCAIQLLPLQAAKPSTKPAMHPDNQQLCCFHPRGVLLRLFKPPF